MKQKVTTYYLEMLTPTELKSKTDSNGLTLLECEVDCWEVNRFLYQLIGKSWHWKDKLSWSDTQWKEYVQQKQLRTWIAYWKGTIAGYFELLDDQKGNIEIVYFGLAEAFIGKGFGGFLLSQAIANAWSFDGAKRVWVHTCSLDHPQALANYQARGLTLFREEIADIDD